MYSPDIAETVAAHQHAWCSGCITYRPAQEFTFRDTGTPLI